jgi:hypothetical protein
MTYEQVCELALALGVWLESIVTPLATSDSPGPVDRSAVVSTVDGTSSVRCRALVRNEN